MSMIPDEIVEQVRDSADLVGIIGEAVELKRTGSDYRGPCPFHGGTHRNFAVIPKKGRYYCFVCHESGDVFSWLMKRLGMDYPTAVREVARRVGIVIPERAARAGPDPLEPLFGAVAVAQDWFTRQLLESADAKAAREYLEGRDIPLDTAALLRARLRAARQGLPRGDGAARHRADRCCSRPGLAAVRDDGSVDPPVPRRGCCSRSTICAAAWLRLRRPAARVRASPSTSTRRRTQIFHKGRQLYNLHQAKSAIRKEETVILVEGYFDVLRLVLRRHRARRRAARHRAHAGPGDAAPPLRARGRCCSTTATRPGSAPPSARATSCSATASACGSPRCPPARIPTRSCAGAARRRSSRSSATPSICSSASFSCSSRRAGSRAWTTSARRSTGCCPRIRAAADPITRDLYLKEVSERTGVSREVLLQQVTARPEPAYARGPRSGRGSSSERARRPRRHPAPTAMTRPARARARVGRAAPGRRGRAGAASRAHEGPRVARARGAGGAARVVRDPGVSRGVRGVASQSRKRGVPDILGSSCPRLRRSARGPGWTASRPSTASPDLDRMYVGRVHGRSRCGRSAASSRRSTVSSASGTGR